MVEEFEKIATRDEMKAEAVKRLEMLKVMPFVIKAFKHGSLMMSEPPFGALYELDDEQKQMVEDVEKRYGGLVYMVVRQPMQFGLCDSLLWVSQYEEEWDYERGDIEEGVVFTYTVNHDADFCSEFGCIGIRAANGGLIRIS